MLSSDRQKAIPDHNIESAIAKVLGCSKGAVRKHLEHIHRKLDVQTRTATVMVALKKLGLLKILSNE